MEETNQNRPPQKLTGETGDDTKGKQVQFQSEKNLTSRTIFY